MKFTKSFYDWCVENNRQDLLDRWDYDLNKKSPNERPFNTRVKTYFKCPCGKHSSTGIYLSMREKSGNYNIICVGCNSFGQWGIDNICNDFLNKYWDYEKNEVDPMVIAKMSNCIVYIKCQEKEYHGSYSVRPYDFVGKGIRCSYCHMQKIHLLDSLGNVYPKSIDFWSNKNKCSPFDVAPKSKRKMWFKCDSGMHGDYCSQVFRAVERNFECPKCHQDSVDSYLQKKVDEYILGNYSFKYNKEFDCSLICINPLTGYQLPYDRELIINNTSKLLIEVNGKQHYEICLHTKTDAKERGITPEEGFKLLQYRDGIKKNYAISNGYEFLIIPYWTEHDESYKTLIDDKIKSILNNQTLTCAS